MTAELTPTTTRRLTAPQRTKLHARLVADLNEADRIEEQLRREIAESVESRKGSTNDEMDDPEGSNIAHESVQSSVMLQQAVRHSREISAAIVRLDNGTYGLCGACGEPIAPGRLEARPSALLCISCAS